MITRINFGGYMFALKTTWTRVLVLLAVLALLAAACGGDDEAEGVDPDVSCAFEDLNLATAGTLTVATGEPVFPPWMGVGDDVFDVPESKTGFEGGLVYALAAELGFSDDQVVFVRTGFTEAIAPGPKDWDFNIQQYSINDERDQVMDFSVPYYTTRQALVTFPDSPFASATSLADLADAKLGAAIGTTSLDFVEDVIKPNTEASVYDENVDVEAAMRAGQIDGLVVDLPAAYFVTAAQVEGSVIAGQFEEGAAAPDNYGMLFADGNTLVSCVNAALAELIDNGKLQELEDTWLTQDGGIPTIGN
jgi:polar amino acid transport system substrate-binding protein